MRQDMLFYKILPMTGMAAMLAGCASPEPYSATPPPRSLGAGYATVEMAAPAQQVSVPNTLRMADAFVLALRGNPELAAFSHEVRAAEALVLQAGVLPNPEIEFEVGEYDRGGEGFDSAETAVVIGQVFELGGKRRWRERIAQAEGELAGWDYEAKRLDVFTQTAHRFTQVIATQKRLEISKSAVILAEQASNAVAERVKAGKEPPLQATKSMAQLEMARMDLQEAENALDVARRNLAMMWGSERVDFETVDGSLDYILDEIPSLEALRPHLVMNPDLARWDAELRLSQAKLSSEKAARIPDLEGSVGYLQFEEDGTDGLAFSIGMPLPLIDRNKGNILAARHGISKAKAQRSAAEIALASELAAAHAELRVSHQRAATLRDKVVPAMEQAFQAAHEGYRQGKFGFLDMLDAQRGLYEAKQAFVDTLGDYQSALIDIQRLTGIRIETILNAKMEK